MRIVLAAILMMLLVGCGYTGKPHATYRKTSVVESLGPTPSTTTTTTEIKVEGPHGAVTPASVQLADGMIFGTSGARQETDQALAALSKSTSWLAIALVLAGVGSIAARMWLPIIPVNASVLLIAAGVAVWFLPILFDRYSLYLFIGLGVIGAMYAYGIFDNRKLAKGDSQ